MDAGQACGVVIGEAFFPQSVIVCKRRTGKGRLGPDNADGKSRNEQCDRQNGQKRGENSVT